MPIFMFPVSVAALKTFRLDPKFFISQKMPLYYEKSEK